MPIVNLGCSQNCGPLLLIEYISAPNKKRYQDGTLILGTTHLHTNPIQVGLGLYVSGLLFEV